MGKIKWLIWLVAAVLIIISVVIFLLQIVEIWLFRQVDMGFILYIVFYLICLGLGGFFWRYFLRVFFKSELTSRSAYVWLWGLIVWSLITIILGVLVVYLITLDRLNVSVSLFLPYRANIFRFFSYLTAFTGLWLLGILASRGIKPYGSYYREISNIDEETIIVVSDVHIGYRFNKHESQTQAFEEFLNRLEKPRLNEENPSNGKIACDRLILCGDIFEMWRRDDAGVILENYKIINLLQEKIKEEIPIHFLVGNHDYYLTTFRNYNYPLFDIYSENEEETETPNPFNDNCLVLTDPENKFEHWIVHGDQFDPIQLVGFFTPFANYSDDLMGGEAVSIWEKLGHLSGWFSWIFGFLQPGYPDVNPIRRHAEEFIKNPQESRFSVRDELIATSNLNTFRVLIYGHHHVPFLHIDKPHSTNNRANYFIGNCGGWIFPALEEPDLDEETIDTNTFIEIKVTKNLGEENQSQHSDNNDQKWLVVTLKSFRKEQGQYSVIDPKYTRPSMIAVSLKTGECIENT
ncbi:MAG: metallophosphoesterase [Candidatus Hodarchaeota archaeon]